MSGTDAFKCMLNLSPPCSIISIILFHNKEAASRTLCSLFANASHVAAAGVDAALDNLLIMCFKMHSFLIDVF